jgi:hypothetical protein
MMHPVPCPECDSKGLKASLEEAASGEIYMCPHCGSQFKQVNEPVRGMIQGCGLGSFMGICSIVLFLLFIVVSPDNDPWYYLVIGVLVLLGIYALLSKAVFTRMVDSSNMKNLEKIHDHR